MGFFNDILEKALPIAGTAFGGPLGGLAGGFLGSQLGGSGGGKGRAPAQLLSTAAQGSLDTGLGTLQGILSSQGKINPLSRNRALTNVDRSTESQVTQNRQSAAGAGLQRSGVVGAGGAVEGALRASGADRRAAVDADFVAQEEKRKRDDLLLMLQLIINPQLQREATAAGVSTANRQIDQQREGALIGGGTDLLSTLLQFFSDR